MTNLNVIEGIGPAYAGKLHAADLKTTEDLLDQCCTRAGRKSIAEATGLSEGLILKWTNHADLMRIKGIGGEFAELLEASGVDSVKELQHRNPTNLALKMVEVNEKKKLTRLVPGEKSIEVWVAQAKEIPPLVQH